MTKQDQVRTLAWGDGAAVLEVEEEGGVDGCRGDGFGGGEAAVTDCDGEREWHGIPWGGAGVAVGGDGEGAAGVHEVASIGVAVVEVEAADGESDAEGWGGGEGFEVFGGGGFEVIDADCVEADGFAGHAQGGELIGVDADGVAGGLGGFLEELDGSRRARPGAPFSQKASMVMPGNSAEMAGRVSEMVRSTKRGSASSMGWPRRAVGMMVPGHFAAAARMARSIFEFVLGGRGRSRF